jgi:hypothetical protein
VASGGKFHEHRRALNGPQLATAVLSVLIAAMIAVVIAYHRGRARKITYPVLCVCAALSIYAWCDFGRFQAINVDASRTESGPSRKKVRKNRPFHFHEFVHYYLGPKYFREVGYLGLYDCIALADRENADEDRVPTRVNAWVRNLDDVLVDKPYSQALADCKNTQWPRFTTERWSSFKNDIRELYKLVDDGAWGSVVYDAGFNPPPSLILVSTQVTNLIPIADDTRMTFVVATSLDLMLLAMTFVFVRHAFGRTTAAYALLFFGATFISHYSWNGGSVMRFSWLCSVICGFCAMKRGRWALAGFFLGLAAIDRIFPAAFAGFAMIPIAVRAVKSERHRTILKRFWLAWGATAAVMVVASGLYWGFDAWSTFFSRIGRHGDVYYVMHIGLKKVMTFRSWVYSKNFHGHDGLARFKDWNLALRATWGGMRPLTWLVQLLVALGAAWAAVRRRPWEAGLLGGVMFMFVFNLPANYYYAIVTFIPALLVRAAATARTPMGRHRNMAAFAGFALFWVFTYMAPHVEGDAIVFNFYICAVFFAFLTLWIVAWIERDSWRDVHALGMKLLRRT